VTKQVFFVDGFALQDRPLVEHAHAMPRSPLPLPWWEG
jgi:hypothetical protein